MTIEEILNSGRNAAQIITALKEKTISVPLWRGRYGLVQEYDPTKHPVMNKAKYPDIVTDSGIEHVTRIIVDLQRLAVKRMTELVCGIPIKRVYKPQNEKQKEIVSFIEAIYKRNRIDSVNIERLNMLFASCEVLTLWYAVEQPNTLYNGVESNLKIRCRNFSPMLGDDLYPLFDEYGDMIAMSIGYSRKNGKKLVQYFDTYTATKHVKWSTENGEWQEIENEDITVIGKIPGIYGWRPTPIYEGTSNIVYEIEWTLSRNGNYLRENSRPIFALFSDEVVSYGDEAETNKAWRTVMQYPKGADAKYITWDQATESLKFQIDTLRNLFFTQLQLPDWSYEKMSQQALSGESRKQMFIDAQLKVKDESGRLLEMFDREMNVIKAFAKVILGDSYHADIDALPVENVITPFTITDDKDTITNLVTANGGKPIMSQRESIAEYGHSSDIDRTMREIAEEDVNNAFEATL